ncbi:MAG: hypothetical protein ABIJ65_07215 [Chloroflexota bacterium]
MVESNTRNNVEITYKNLTAFLRLPLDGCPEVTSKASEICKYAAGKYTIPNHSNRKKKFIASFDMEALPRASLVKITTTHNKIIANERATRSRRLNESEYKNREKAVIAIPAVNI